MTTSKIIIKPQFDKVNIFSGGLAMVKVGCKYGFTINPLTNKYYIKKYYSVRASILIYRCFL
ncbi:WG repeat-containing protein [Clostridium bowmanii]|uniref:WG repeat-containing protein n=1 Tax=Clostridium bowmanii TaxID=132925 RepID=UPI0035E43953